MKINQSSFSAVSPKETEDNRGRVAYGEKNLFPQYLEELAQSSPVHGALVSAISQMIAGKAFNATNPVAMAAIKQWGLDKHRTQIASDVKHHGGYFLEVIYTVDRTSIATVNHLPYTDCRFNIDKESGDVIGVDYSRDWSQANGRLKRFKPVLIPKFDFDKRNEDCRQVIWTMGNISSNQYYSKPDYISALNYIEIDKQVSIYHVNNLLNGFFPSHVIKVYGEIPSVEQQLATKKAYEDKLGAREAGGVMILYSENKDLGTEFDAFPLTDADKQYQFLSDETTKKIMLAHRVTSPLLFGIRDGSGLGSNKDEIATSWELFTNQVLEPSQRMICEPITELLKAVNIVSEVSIVPNTPLKALAQPTQPVQQSAQTNALIELGEDAPQGYFLLDAFKVDGDEEDNAHTLEVKQASTGTARPNAGSEQDKTINGDLFITRYRYRGNTSPQRPFCQAMMGANKLYRKEDIVSMENKPVNKGWGPEGADTYSIWQYKGGGSCYHYWQKEVYMSIEGAGIDVNNPNARQMAVAKAEKLGYKVRNEKEVAQLPIDMPFNGFLPTNPRFN